MLTFPTTLVQDYGIPACLCFYKVVAVTEFPTFFPHGILRLQETGAEQWQIGLCEYLVDAVERARKIYGLITKETHVVLEITFSPLGLAHYTKICLGPNYCFQPLLHKKSYRDDTDWKVWHFHGDLPLQASDAQDNVLITTRLMEIF